jgi:hypothetical protein
MDSAFGTPPPYCRVGCVYWLAVALPIRRHIEFDITARSVTVAALSAIGRMPAFLMNNPGCPAFQA